ncbi:MAG: UbiD family decarboxylase [Acidobacteria bacterium]|nr:UbiD family decarboxylase [Acidobacteriota bacterium]
MAQVITNEKQGRPPARAELDNRDLRIFLEVCEREGMLKRVTREVDAAYEIATMMWELHEKVGLDAPVVIFEKVRGYEMPVVKNVLGNYKRIALAAHMENWRTAERKDVIHYLAGKMEKMDQWIPPVLVDARNAPCKEVVVKGDDVNLNKIPILKWHPDDGGPFILMGAVCTRDPQWGFNFGCYRLHQYDGKTTGVVCNVLQDIGIYVSRARMRGEQAIDCAVAIGFDQTLYITSGIKMPVVGRDAEFRMAGALKGSPIELVKCELSDLQVPASAEIVLEGKLSTSELEEEGPFSEWMGYTAAGSMKHPIFKVQCITHRKNPLFQSCVSAHIYSETQILYSIPYVRWYNEMQRSVVGFRDLALPLEMRNYYAVISITKRVPGWGKQAIYSALGSGFGMATLNGVIVVDEDVNIYDINDVLFAIATRVDPELDIVILPPMGVNALNPSVRSLLPVKRPGEAFGMISKIGIDATRKFDTEYGRTKGTPKMNRPDPETLKRVRDEWSQYGLKL